LEREGSQNLFFDRVSEKLCFDYSRRVDFVIFWVLINRVTGFW